MPIIFFDDVKSPLTIAAAIVAVFLGKMMKNMWIIAMVNRRNNPQTKDKK